ncbi:MAG: M1 family metallopeptidase [Candidatus Bipolaricaulaceae bacterium]
MRGLVCAVLVAVSGAAADLQYDLQLAYAGDGTLVGSAEITGVAPAAWGEVVLRVYPGTGNLWPVGFAANGDRRDAAAVGNHAVTFPVELAAGQTFSLAVDFRGRVPVFAASQGYGTFARSAGAVVLAQAYPMLAPWRGGWIAWPNYRWGDAVVAEVADYSATFTFPPDWAVVSGGVECTRGPGRAEVRGESLRELVVILLRGYETSIQTVGQIQVRSFYLPAHRVPGQAALQVTAEALQIYQERLGPYPFPQLDVVEVPLQEAAGVEYPGLILAGEEYYERYPRDDLFFPMIFAHEVAHQWWYAQVGNDQVAEPWLDEALATYTSGLYFQTQGRLASLVAYWEDGYRRGTRRAPATNVSSPVWAFGPHGAGYSGVVYSGGALFLHQLRGRMGDEAFWLALRRYLSAFRWDMAQAQDFLSILAAESPAPIDELVARWLELALPAPRP